MIQAVKQKEKKKKAQAKGNQNTDLKRNYQRNKKKKVAHTSVNQVQSKKIKSNTCKIG